MTAINCIYKISSKIKPEKFYIGSTVNFINRQNRHKTSLKHQRHANSILQNHYNKYGKEDLIFEILESDISIDNLLNREQFYMNILKPTFNILKIAGSPLGYKASEETKIKISEALKKRVIPKEELDILSERMKGNTYRKGIKHTAEVIEQMSIQKQGNQYAKGSIRSQEFKDNLSKINKGKIISQETREKNKLGRSKPVIQFTEDGIFIKEWGSAKEVKNVLGIGQVGCCCKGTRNIAGGFKWKYKIDYN